MQEVPLHLLTYSSLFSLRDPLVSRVINQYLKQGIWPFIILLLFSTFHTKMQKKDPTSSCFILWVPKLFLSIWLFGKLSGFRTENHSASLGEECRDQSWWEVGGNRAKSSVNWMPVWITQITEHEIMMEQVHVF